MNIMKCDGCGKFMGETNPPVKEKEYPVFDPRQEQWYPEVFQYCSKCTTPEEESNAQVVHDPNTGKGE